MSKNLFMAAGLAFSLLAPSAFSASASKSCDELKSEIQSKLQAKGVKGFTLDIVAKDSGAKSAKVVGSCGGGKQRITYTRGK